MKILFGAILVVGALIGETAVAQSGTCPATCDVIDIHGTADKTKQIAQRQLIKDCLATPNKTVRLGPDVDLDFKDVSGGFFPITFGRHSSLVSVADFEPEVLGHPSVSPPGGPNLARTASAAGGAGCNILHNSAEP